MSDETEIVVLEKCRSADLARMIASALRSEGIPAYADGNFLQDGFAISQEALGIEGVAIQVPRDRLEEARALLHSMREAGRLLAEERGDEDGGEE